MSEENRDSFKVSYMIFLMKNQSETIVLLWQSMVLSWSWEISCKKMPASVKCALLYFLGVDIQKLWLRGGQSYISCWQQNLVKCLPDVKALKAFFALKAWRGHEGVSWGLAPHSRAGVPEEKSRLQLLQEKTHGWRRCGKKWYHVAESESLKRAQKTQLVKLELRWSPCINERCSQGHLGWLNSF